MMEETTRTKKAGKADHDHCKINTLSVFPLVSCIPNPFRDLAENAEDMGKFLKERIFIISTYAGSTHACVYISTDWHSCVN